MLRNKIAENESIKIIHDKMIDANFYKNVNELSVVIWLQLNEYYIQLEYITKKLFLRSQVIASNKNALNPSQKAYHWPTPKDRLQNLSEFNCR